ncbi:hypothetical protein HMPREF1423_01120 [Helicobacter pylori GAM270ASi]|nr:hypothetical protein HMPREF1423_01120 [Helicobacter pylori GAM270ASi]
MTPHLLIIFIDYFYWGVFLIKVFYTPFKNPLECSHSIRPIS